MNNKFLEKMVQKKLRMTVQAPPIKNQQRYYEAVTSHE